MVNLSYRNSSAIHRAAQMVRDGAIGRVIHFEACYLQSWLVSWLLMLPIVIFQ